MHPFEDLQVADDQAGIHWFGQSSYAIKDSQGTIVQVDPYFPRERPPDRFVHARSPLDEATLPTDFILLTHHHGDHTCIESILRIQAAYPEVCCIGPKESVQAVQEAGIPVAQTQTLTAGQSAAMNGMTAHAVWSKPPGGIPAESIDPPGVEHLGYVIDTGAARIYLSGDPVHSFAEHEELVAPVRALQPDIGFLTTHPSEGEFPFLEGAARLARKIGLKTAVPSHYQCFVRRDYDPQEFIRALHGAGGVQGLIIAYNQSVLYSPR